MAENDPWPQRLWMFGDHWLQPLPCCRERLPYQLGPRVQNGCVQAAAWLDFQPPGRFLQFRPALLGQVQVAQREPSRQEVRSFGDNRAPLGFRLGGLALLVVDDAEVLPRLVAAQP